MKTEKQVKRLLQSENKRVLSHFRNLAQKYEAMYNSAADDVYRRISMHRLLALRELAECLGYDWARDIINRTQEN